MNNLKTILNSGKLSEWEQEEIKKVYKKILSGKIYAEVVSVSKSGMSRRIKFFYADKSNIARATVFIGWLTGWIKPGEYKQGNKYLIQDGLAVGGCGMDIIMHTLYTALGYEEAKAWNQYYSNL